MVKTDGKWRIRNASMVPFCIKEIETELIGVLSDDSLRDKYPTNAWKR